MEDQKTNRNRNAYLLFIGAGVFLLVQHVFGFEAIVALFLIFLGVQYIQSDAKKRGYVMLAIGLLFIMGDKMTIVVALIFIFLGLFYLKSKQQPKESNVRHKQRIIDSVKYDKGPWVLNNLSQWSLIGEMHMDLSLAIFEEKEVTVVLQGVIADIDLIVPEDVGVSIESSVLFGQIDVPHRKEEGMLNKLSWKSPNYDICENRVKFVVSYVVADIDIKVV
ncbi:Predicted membrane protein [Chlamydia abortus]|uniref:Cell wall-active antibiotics response protein LiaF n=1 Tax=Paenibacillus residui TaxID=629724 RepID=A0ABW3D649_9BACL|nr:cell wall-active antibiotics response protein LiaF [Paenibacillus sp. 32O-W]SHE13577.1 Predicted membrane protein [Chlamydia abortus]